MLREEKRNHLFDRPTSFLDETISNNSIAPELLDIPLVPPVGPGCTAIIVQLSDCIGLIFCISVDCEKVAEAVFPPSAQAMIVSKQYESRNAEIIPQ